MLATRNLLKRRLASTNALLAVVCLAQFMVILDVSIVNIALPSIRDGLHFSTTGLQWVVNAYTLTFAGLLMLGGRSADLLGRRRVFLAGTAMFAVSSLVCALASSRGLLIGARGIQGIAGAVSSPATLSIITQAFPPEQRGMAIGTWAGVSALALAIGPVLGGFLTEQVSWRAIFFINPPIAVIAVAVTLFAARESRDESVSRTVDFPGIAAITIGLTALVLALVWLGVYPAPLLTLVESVAATLPWVQ